MKVKNYYNDSDDEDYEEIKNNKLNNIPDTPENLNNNNNYSKENSTLSSAKSISFKNDIIKVLKSEIDEINTKLSFFYINQDNFSKATKIEIDEFVELIKDNEEIFTLYEKEKFIFINNHINISHLGIEKNNVNNDNVPNLFHDKSFTDILKSTLDIISLKLSSLKKTLEQSFSNENNKYKINNSESKEINLLLEGINKIISTSTKQLKKVDKDKIEVAKHKLKEIKELQLEKDLRIRALKMKEKELSYFENLPKNCEDLKLIIELKTKEIEKYSSITPIKDKINKNNNY